jgi:glycine cleavage system H protein
MSELKENPDDRKYTKEHEWVKVSDGIAIVGVTDFAQHALTDVVFVELPEIGKKVQKKSSFALLESVKSVSDVYAPVSGEITEVNKELETDAGLINKDPFEKGWIAKIKISSQEELNDCMSKEEYEEYLKTQKH